MKMQLLTVEDQTSPGTLTSGEFSGIVEALTLQATKDFNTSPWVEHGYAPPVEVRLLAKGEQIPDGAWNLILLDELPKEVGEGTLGFHEDTNGDIPYSEIGVKECLASNTPVSEVLTHEAWEMVCDPYVVGKPPRIAKYDGKDWIVEVADPVESCGYDPGNGHLVTDFCWPRWFGMTQTRPEYSQRQSIQAPFTLAAQGYISTRPEGGSEQDWTQTFGDSRTVLPVWASRLPRIHGKTDRQLLELLPNINRRIIDMEDVLAGLAADEAQLATIVPKLIERDEQASKKLAEFEAKSAAGEVVPTSEVETLKTGFDQSIVSLKALLPAEPVTPAAPTKAVYLHTGDGAIDAAWTPSGFETVPVAAVPAVPANQETGAPETPEVPAKPAEPVYYFSGDTASGETNGTSAEWTPYTGAVQLVPAA